MLSGDRELCSKTARFHFVFTFVLLKERVLLNEMSITNSILNYIKPIRMLLTLVYNV